VFISFFIAFKTKLQVLKFWVLSHLVRVAPQINLQITGKILLKLDSNLSLLLEYDCRLFITTTYTSLTLKYLLWKDFKNRYSQLLCLMIAFKSRVHCFSMQVVKNKCFFLNHEKKWRRSALSFSRKPQKLTLQFWKMTSPSQRLGYSNNQLISCLIG